MKRHYKLSIFVTYREKPIIRYCNSYYGIEQALEKVGCIPTGFCVAGYIVQHYNKETNSYLVGETK